MDMLCLTDCCVFCEESLNTFCHKSYSCDGAQTKVKLNISQLTFATLAQPGRPQSTSQEVPGSNPTGETFLLIYLSLS